MQRTAPPVVCGGPLVGFEQELAGKPQQKMVRTSPKADLWISPEALSGRYGSTSVLWKEDCVGFWLRRAASCPVPKGKWCVVACWPLGREGRKRRNGSGWSFGGTSTSELWADCASSGCASSFGLTSALVIGCD